VAAAFTVPAGLSIITTTFAEGSARNKALSIYTVVGASGFSLGLVFGGLVTPVDGTRLPAQRVLEVQRDQELEGEVATQRRVLREEGSDLPDRSRRLTARPGSGVPTGKPVVSECSLT
jgi:hypothetical protein